MRFDDITPDAHESLISLSGPAFESRDWSGHTALVDGDLIIYRCAFANKENTVTESVLANVDACIGLISRKLNVGRLLWFHTEGKCFRHALGLPRLYKGNRKEKPFWHAQIRRHCIEKHGFVSVEGFEADDCIAWINENGFGKYIIYSCDKDFMQLKSTIFDFFTGRLVTVDSSQADYNFNLQLLMGDQADNIPGITGIGEKKAARFLNGMAAWEHYEAISDFYNKSYADDGQKYFFATQSALLLQTDPYNAELLSELAYLTI